MSTQSGPIRVILAEDNQLVRMGVASLLAAARDIELVGEAKDGVVALALWKRERPDVLITDLKMPTFDGIALTSAVTKESPPGRVLVLTQYEGDESIYRALQAGALGYVTKETPGDEILNAVRTVARGTRYIPLNVAARLADRAALPELTARELQVLQLIFDGLSNREIAQKLELAERTIGIYVSNLFGKLDVHNRAEAISAALRRGLLSPK